MHEIANRASTSRGERARTHPRAHTRDTTAESIHDAELVILCSKMKIDNSLDHHSRRLFGEPTVARGSAPAY